MTISVNTKSGRWLVTSVFMAVLLLFSTLLAKPALAVQSDENPQVTQLLEDARGQAAVLSKDADEMEALTRSDVSWQSHAYMLDKIKEDVNNLGRTAEKLQAARDSASPWQQQAIDRMMPLLKDLAANTTAAINHLRENQIRPATGSYTEYLKENTETAHELSNMISSFVQYGEERAKLEKLEQKLEIASK
ncbi:MAG: hypothetical protein JWO91_2781 [Acidobacteriaceae bacterium]|nr:hypothetical protein [Acidobacteriaceae bacterium]